MNTNNLIATSIISPILAYILPIEDISIRISISMIITNAIFQYYEYILSFFNLTFGYNYVVIDSKNQLYTQLIDIINANFINNIKKCELQQNINKNIYHIRELKYPIKIIHNNNDIYIKFEENRNDTKNTNTNRIVFYSKSNITLIKEYINHIIETKQKTQINTMTIWKPIINNVKKNKYHEWISIESYTNKTFDNTFYPDSVTNNFFNCVKEYLDSEDKFNKKGLNYKKTFLLHGEPGCGKTSAVKLIASTYNLPIFIIDIDQFSNNNELTKTINNIESNISKNGKYIVLLEDIDRTKFMSHNRYSKTEITDNCFLNILDGVENTHGRILIMTTNNISVLNTIVGLTRPGRIDNTVEFTPCDTLLATKILQYHFECDVVIPYDIKIHQCKLIQLIETYKSIDEILANISSIKNKTTSESTVDQKEQQVKKRSIRPSKTTTLLNIVKKINSSSKDIPIDQQIEMIKLKHQKKESEQKLLCLKYEQKKANISEDLANKLDKILHNKITNVDDIEDILEDEESTRCKVTRIVKLD